MGTLLKQFIQYVSNLFDVEDLYFALLLCQDNIFPDLQQGGLEMPCIPTFSTAMSNKCLRCIFISHRIQKLTEFGWAKYW